MVERGETDDSQLLLDPIARQLKNFPQIYIILLPAYSKILLSLRDVAQEIKRSLKSWQPMLCGVHFIYFIWFLIITFSFCISVTLHFVYCILCVESMNRNYQRWESFLWILQNKVFVLCSVEVVKVAQGAQIEQSALTKRAVNCQTKRSAPVLTTKHIFPNYKIYLQRAFNFCSTTALQISKYQILKSVCISYEGTKLLPIGSAALQMKKLPRKARSRIGHFMCFVASIHCHSLSFPHSLASPLEENLR